MASKVLLLGYGNPGRLDDGLGPACVEALERLGIDGVTVEADYQLTVEDAEAAARHDVVVFADAAAAGPEPFAFRTVRPAAGMSFSTHSVEPGAVLALARDVFGARPRGYALAIRGYAFDEFREGLSGGANRNLGEAVRFLAGAIREGSLARHAGRSAKEGSRSGLARAKRARGGAGSRGRKRDER